MSWTFKALGFTAVVGLATCTGLRGAPPLESFDDGIRVDRVMAFWMPREASLVAAQRSAVTLLVRVADAPEMPVAQARVTLTPLQSHADSVRTTEGNESGVAALAGLAPGRWRVEVRAPVFPIFVADVDLVVGCRSRLEVYLPRYPICEMGCAITRPRLTITSCHRAV